ncbi:DNA (cytosine-5)-methyltransferase 1 [Desulfomicrobium apsheronum]|uniref:DNA (cytosine-5-)-methyltransferase n=1 Tax=Desulfomicrobium apsheronum TaxID=52560 RepID=A0A1I3Y7Q7_9BACT|nr:DNA cytosine methyltransferase [Desulfomicrobium apsheronum]SFK27855.1 DNA (cytosine-5)-methyltransferase 1 [Desulfomicrobium apsheronum]
MLNYKDDTDMVASTKKAKTNTGLKAVDFFCGAGGMTCGLAQAGIQVLAGIDNNAECKETYSINNAPSEFLEYDISELNPPILEDKIGISPNDDELILVGCSPCQYWSKIRTIKKKSEKSAFLLEEFQKFVRHFHPGFVIIENVPGLYKDPKSYLPTFLRFLTDQGYTYAHEVVDSYHHGVPQKRPRYLLIATRLNCGASLPEKEKLTGLRLRDFIGVGNGFPPIEAGHKDDSDFIHTAAGLSEENLRRIKVTPHNGGTRFSWKDDPELQIEAYKEKDNCFRNVYGRAFWDQPAPTITTRFNSLSNGRFGHPEENRAFSLREGATLQTFPKDYVFRCSNESGIAKQIGNAVPPVLAKKIGTHIQRILEHGDI